MVDALAPREGSDGTWHCNKTLNSLDLNSTVTCSCIPCPFPLLLPALLTLEDG